MISIMPQERPTRLVGLYHGLGGSPKSLQPLAQKWADSLPRTAFVLLESGGGDWFPYPKQRHATEEDRVKMVIETIQAAMTRTDAVLDEQCAAMGLTNSELILGGFSQGAAMSAYTGLRRGCLGVLPMSGPCPPRSQLLPDTQATRVCVISGDRDNFAPHDQLISLFGKYTPKASTDGVHIVSGLNHRISEEHAELGTAFLKSCGCE